MERFTARAQLILALVTLVAFLGLVYLLALQPIALEDSQKELLEKILAALVIIVTQQSSYWFARQRPNNPPEIPTLVDAVNPRAAEIGRRVARGRELQRLIAAIDAEIARLERLDRTQQIADQIEKLRIDREEKGAELALLAT